VEGLTERKYKVAQALLRRLLANTHADGPSKITLKRLPRQEALSGGLIPVRSITGHRTHERSRVRSGVLERGRIIRKMGYHLAAQGIQQGMAVTVREDG